jgi:hypothetical protein
MLLLKVINQKENKHLDMKLATMFLHEEKGFPLNGHGITQLLNPNYYFFLVFNLQDLFNNLDR